MTGETEPVAAGSAARRRGGAADGAAEGAGRAATQRDIARALGVSSATVSRALAGDPAISQATRQRIVATGAELGYRPNRAARALRRRETQTIGIVVPRLSNPFFPALVEAIEAELHALGYGLMLCDSQEDVATERDRIETLVEHQVDGLLVIPCDTAASAAALRATALRTALVQVDRAVHALPADRIGVDSELGAALAVEHLRELGRGRIAFVGAEASIPAAAERLHGFQRAMGSAAAESPILLGDFSRDWGRSATARLLATEARPDALVCGNDLIAFGALEALAQAGVRVPHEIAVVGFDDVPFAALTAPPLTSVRQPTREIAEGAVRLLLERLSDRDRSPRRIDIAPTLSIRASTAAPAAAAGARSYEG